MERCKIYKKNIKKGNKYGLCSNCQTMGLGIALKKGLVVLK
jgi:hypothetical protein